MVVIISWEIFYSWKASCFNHEEARSVLQFFLNNFLISFLILCMISYDFELCFLFLQPFVVVGLGADSQRVRTLACKTVRTDFDIQLHHCLFWSYYHPDHNYWYASSYLLWRCMFFSFINLKPNLQVPPEAFCLDPCDLDVWFCYYILSSFFIVSILCIAYTCEGVAVCVYHHGLCIVLVH